MRCRAKESTQAKNTCGWEGLDATSDSARHRTRRGDDVMLKDSWLGEGIDEGEENSWVGSDRTRRGEVMMKDSSLGEGAQIGSLLQKATWLPFEGYVPAATAILQVA
jgi:hypothetical protein